MSTNTKTSPNILDQFTPEVLGIFWVTSAELSRELAGFDDFNYLFDGLLSQYLYGQETTSNQHAHIFFTQNFNNKVFLAHLRTKDLTKSQISGDIDEQVALIEAKNPARKTILILDKTSDEWMPELKKRYSQFEFKALDI